jgi:transcriptional regulator with XRE-family HTH domain
MKKSYGAPHDLIRALRSELGMTQAQLARRVGLPQSHVAKIETGRVDLQIGTLRRIARAMFCEIDLVPRFKTEPRAVVARRAKEVRRKDRIWDEPLYVMDRSAVRIVAKEDPRADLEDWLKKTPEERVGAVEFLRRQMHLVTGKARVPRIRRIVAMRARGT